MHAQLKKANAYKSGRGCSALGGKVDYAGCWGKIGVMGFGGWGRPKGRRIKMPNKNKALALPEK